MEPANLNFDISLEKDAGGLNTDGKLYGSSVGAEGEKKKINRRGAPKPVPGTTVSYQPDATQDDAAATTDPSQAAKKSPSIISIEYWQPFFNLETSELKKRIVFSLNPAKTSQFLELVDKQPDMYGPFWICSFLILTIIICSSLSAAMKRIMLGEERKLAGYNYENIGFVFCLIYGFLFGFPLIFTILLKVFGSELTFIKVHYLLTSESLRLWVFLYSFCSLIADHMVSIFYSENCSDHHLRSVHNGQIAPDLQHVSRLSLRALLVAKPWQKVLLLIRSEEHTSELQSQSNL